MSISAPSGVSAPRANISGYKLRNTPNYTPQQMQLFSQLLGGVQGQGLTKGLENLQGLAAGGEEGFEQLEAPAYTAFQKGIGQLGSQFAGLGALGSSGFQNAAAGQARQLAENLGSQRMGIQQNALERLLGLSDTLLGKKPFESFLQKKSGFGDILKHALPGILSLLGG